MPGPLGEGWALLEAGRARSEKVRAGDRGCPPADLPMEPSVRPVARPRKEGGFLSFCCQGSCRAADKSEVQKWGGQGTAARPGVSLAVQHLPDPCSHLHAGTPAVYCQEEQEGPAHVGSFTLPGASVQRVIARSS